RRFLTDRPYQKLVTDTTELRYGSKSMSERLYLNPVLDLFSGEVLSYKLSEHLDLNSVLSPVGQAFKRLPKLNYRTTIHTDQGCHYQHRKFISLVKKNHVIKSMSRKAT
ncbi:transposase, partial [Fructilactobacillus fructivorans]|uniref:DDE-type integrase/transposase/recombinase n=4 Tax=Fructilactobacillus fructivorans TaxID=1614 RepID=UPI0021A43FA8